jgi:hypothetical protein
VNLTRGGLSASVLIYYFRDPMRGAWNSTLLLQQAP